jgi:precorrin-6B methylase 2
MAAPEEINADMLAFWNGKDTDITLAPVTDALLAFAAPRAGERVADIGCGCGAPTLEFARAVGPSGRVAGLEHGRTIPLADISRLALLQRNSKAQAHPEGRKISAANASQSCS